MFIESEFPAGDYIALIETYWRGPNQQFTFGAYGPDMVGIRKIITNNQHFKDVEYMIWKDYAMSPEFQNDLKVAAEKLVTDGQKEAPLTIY